MSRLWKSCAAALALTLAVPPAAWAQEDTGDQKAADTGEQKPTANAEAEAKQAFLRGQDAFKLGRYADAIQAFEDAYRLSHKIEILFNIGLANRKAYGIENKPEYLRRALDIYKQFLRLAPDEAERKAAKQNISEVNDELAAIDERERIQRLRTGSGPPLLQAALKLFSENKPGDALNQLETLLRRGSNPSVVLQDIYRLEGEIGVEAGQSSLSLEAYKRLLALSPSFDLAKSASAGARTNLAKAREFWATQGTFSISPAVPPPAVPDEPLSIPVTVDADPLSMVSRVTLRYRRAGERRFSSVSRAGAGEVVIPAMALPAEEAGFRMEYFIVVTDQFNNVLTTIGGDTAPLSFPVLSPEEVKKLNDRSGPFYASWWFWTGTSILVVGAVITVILITSASTPPNATFGQSPNIKLNADPPALFHF